MDSMATAAYALVQDALFLPQQHRIKAMIASLPILEKDSEGVDLEEPCPICLMSLSAVFEEQETEKAKGEAGQDGEEEALGLGGVTKLEGCGHIFCRRDLTEWIRSKHGSCPTCRHTFLDIRPPSESDDESSDGGEYIPNDDDFEDEDEDAFIDVDGFTDTDAEDFPVQRMDLDFDELWEDESVNGGATGLAEEMDDDVMADEEMEDVIEEEEVDRGSEWGLTDGESESMSSFEGEVTMDGDDGEGNNVALETEVSVSVHEDDEDLDIEQEGGHIDHNLVAASDSQEPK